jgi:hypothetical protein
VDCARSVLMGHTASSPALLEATATERGLCRVSSVGLPYRWLPCCPPVSAGSGKTRRTGGHLARLWRVMKGW